jgi:hypothetical protein
MKARWWHIQNVMAFPTLVEYHLGRVRVIARTRYSGE